MRVDAFLCDERTGCGVFVSVHCRSIANKTVAFFLNAVIIIKLLSY